MVIGFFGEHYQFGVDFLLQKELTTVIFLVLYVHIVKTLFKFHINCLA